MRATGRILAAVVLAAPLLLAGAADAATGWGPRVGATIDPDQVHAGVHANFGDVFADRVRFQPNFELGFGDDLTVAALNFEASYRFVENWESWSPYAGGGVGLNWYSWDADHDFPGHDDTEMEAGLNILGGIEKGIGNGDSFFLELKLGLADSPDMKVTAGWTFF